MIEYAVLGTSIVLQFVAAFLALYLIRFTGWRVAWSMIAGAMVLMGVRRSITFYHSIVEGASAPPDLSAELVALTISVLMVVGAAKIAPIFEASRRNEEALRESEEQSRATFEQAAAGICHFAPDGRFLRVNQKLCEITGYSQAELLEKTFQDITHPDDLDADLGYVDQVLADEISTYSLEKRYFRKDGSIVWINLTVSLVRRASGAPNYFIAVIEDITERKRAETALREGRELLSSIIDNASVEISLKDRGGRYTLINPQFEKGHGRDAEDIIGKTAYDLFSEKFAKIIAAMDEKVVETNAVVEQEIEASLSDGIHTFMSVKFPVRNALGEVMEIGSISMDITGRKKAEAALRESEEQVRLLMNSTAEAIYGIDLEGNCSFANPACAEMLGYDRAEDLLGKHMHDLIHHTRPDGTRYPAEECLIYQAFARGEGTHVEDEVLWRRDGTSFPAEYWSHPVRRDGEVVGAVVTFLDITERRQAEAALHRLGTAVEGVSEFIALYDAEDRLILFNRAFREMNREVAKSITLGMTFEKLMRTIVAKGLVPEAAGREEAWLRERLERHQNPGDPVEIARQDGIWLLTHEQRLPDGGTISISLDVTERKRADAALRASEARLAGLLDIAPEAVISIDAGGRIQLFNQGAEAIFGYRSEDIMGQPLEVLLPPRIRAHHARFIEGFAHAPEASRRMGGRREISALRKDGTEFPAAGSISKLGVGAERLFTVVLRDLTEQRLAEESERQLRSQLAHASRLSTVGNMATGLAHEISQPLSAIGSYVQASIRLLRSGKESTGDVIADLEKADQQVTRAADIVKWLRGIVAKEETKMIALDLNACIQEVTDFSEFEFHTRKCKLVVDLADSLPAVMADKVQIQQVILNLLQNSMEAAEQSARTGCQLKVRTSASADGTVRVEVEDSGPGIAPEIRVDLFSPFVTTKRDGLGFGLSISKSIIEAHDGRIWAVSDAGRGATFAFTLPTAGADAKVPQDVTIFVVDDDEALKDSLYQLFRSAGFEVRTFGSGEEFLAGYKPGRVGCLIADVRMPGMSGFDLKKEMTARAIDLPVIMITGDGDRAVERRARKAGVVAFFQKPVTVEVLLGAVEAAIARGPVLSD